MTDILRQAGDVGYRDLCVGLSTGVYAANGGVTELCNNPDAREALAHVMLEREPGNSDRSKEEKLQDWCQRLWDDGKVITFMMARHADIELKLRLLCNLRGGAMHYSSVYLPPNAPDW